MITNVFLQEAPTVVQGPKEAVDAVGRETQDAKLVIPTKVLER